MEIYQILSSHHGMNKRDLASHFQVSEDTILRELTHLIHLGIVSKKGVGTATVYYGFKS
jgi:DeoR/GlpR family transcriptional regulator of sugar metabolism